MFQAAKHSRILVCLIVVQIVVASCACAADKPRLIVLTDIGGDPDDQQSLIRLMTHANDFDIEGLIATAVSDSSDSPESNVNPQLISEIVGAYGEVRNSLARHRPGFPQVSDLQSRIRSGSTARGMTSVGEGHDTEGSRLIISAVDRVDPRPVNIAIWGAATDLAQALWRIRTDRTESELIDFFRRLRVHAISHQDNTGPWIVEQFPDLSFVLNRHNDGEDKRESSYRGMYLGGEESLTSRDWLETHISRDHGPLGALYPLKTWTDPNPNSALKEGDTPSWFFFLPHGLNDSTHPEWGGWGGRFTHEGAGLYRDAADTVDKTTSRRATVWRWREAYQADFQARMDWCVKSTAEANHHPFAVIDDDRTNEIIIRSVSVGESVRLNCSQSADVDGDQLKYRWWIYPEAGTFDGSPEIERDSTSLATIRVPAEAAGQSIHVILEVTDMGLPPLTAYRRIVLNVAQPAE